jgi:hypothetical protein
MLAHRIGDPRGKVLEVGMARFQKLQEQGIGFARVNIETPAFEAEEDVGGEKGHCQERSPILAASLEIENTVEDAR